VNPLYFLVGELVGALLVIAAVAICRGAREVWRRAETVQPGDEPDMPYVCPGCHAVGGDACSSWCPDAAVEAERLECELYGEPETFDDQVEAEDEEFPS
jgi:hypothetical protein